MTWKRILVRCIAEHARQTSLDNLSDEHFMILYEAVQFASEMKKRAFPKEYEDELARRDRHNLSLFEKNVRAELENQK